MDPLPPDAEKVAALRAALPATGAGIYLDTATAGPLPAETAAAMREADEWELRVGRAAAGREDDTAQRAAEARAVLAALIGAEAAEIALFAGVAMALSAAVLSIGLEAGDEALSTTLDGPDVLAALAALRSGGVGVRVLALSPTATPEDVVASLAAATTERTRLIVSSCVSPIAGTVMPVEKLAELVHRRDGWLVADASQAAAALALSVPGMGADFVAFATDRWALGPEATAGLWVGPRAARNARPRLTGRDGFETLSAAGVATPWPDGRRFEAATLPRTTLLGLARSVGWLEMYVGLEWAFSRSATLARLLRTWLEQPDGAEVLTPGGAMATIVTFRLNGWTADEAAEELGRRVFAIVRPLPEIDALRASVAWFNTADELERFAAAVAELAAHTPATVPRRPTLVVLPPGDGRARDVEGQ